MYEFYNDVEQAQRAPEGRLFEMKNEKEYEYSSSYMVQHKLTCVYDIILSLTNNKLRCKNVLPWMETNISDYIHENVESINQIIEI